ncbi:DUF4277 domain-containing protein [Streptomyces sp. NPDC005151]
MIESVVTKRLGALPVAAEFLRRLDVAGIVDALCPPDPRAELTHGQVIEVLVANRELAPPGRGRPRRKQGPEDPPLPLEARPARPRELDENCTMRG